MNVPLRVARTFSEPGGAVPLGRLKGWLVAAFGVVASWRPSSGLAARRSTLRFLALACAALRTRRDAALVDAIWLGMRPAHARRALFWCPRATANHVLCASDCGLARYAKRHSC